MVIAHDKMRKKIFLSYFKLKQEELQSQFDTSLRYVYFDVWVMRCIFGHSYKRYLTELETEGSIVRDGDRRTKWDKQLFVYKPMSKRQLRCSVELCEDDYKLPRFKKIIQRLISIHENLRFDDMGYKAATYDVKSITIDGKRLRGRFNTDKFGGRLYTPFTRLTSEFKHRCILDGEELTEIDMKQCQPKLLSHFLSGIDANIDFVLTVESEDIYEKIMSRYDIHDRDDAKMEYYRIVYGRNNGRGDKRFKEMFPEAYKHIHKIKTQGYEGCIGMDKLHVGITKMMHLKEVSLFKHLWFMMREEGFKFATCHDAVYVKRSDEQRAYDFIKEYFRSKGIMAEFGVNREGHKKVKHERKRVVSRKVEEQAVA